MKKFSLLLLLILFTSTLNAAPVFYLSTRNTDGGIFQINPDTQTATRIDAFGNTGHCFPSLSIYDDSKLVVTDAYTLKIHVFDLDGNLENSVSTAERPEDVVMMSDNLLYYGGYYSSNLNKIENGIETTYCDASSGSAATSLAIRSNGNFLLGTRTLGIIEIDETLQATPIAGSIPCHYYLRVDSNDNIYYQQSLYGAQTISMVSDSNQVSQFWQKSSGDPDINLIYNFAYDKTDDVFYGLGTATDDSINLYKFVDNGQSVTVTTHISDISGITGGYDFALDESDLQILNFAGETIPEPTTLILLFTSSMAYFIKRK